MPVPVRYVHVLSFRAVHQLFTERTDTPEHPIHGHHYTVELGFEDAEGYALQLPERPTTTDTIGVLTEFIRTALDGQDLSRFGFRTTPLGIAWYLFERVSEDPHTSRDLTDITIVVDGADRYTFRPLPTKP